MSELPKPSLAAASCRRSSLRMASCSLLSIVCWSCLLFHVSVRDVPVWSGLVWSKTGPGFDLRSRFHFCSCPVWSGFYFFMSGTIDAPGKQFADWLATGLTSTPWVTGNESADLVQESTNTLLVCFLTHHRSPGLHSHHLQVN